MCTHSQPLGSNGTGLTTTGAIGHPSSPTGSRFCLTLAISPSRAFSANTGANVDVNQPSDGKREKLETPSERARVRESLSGD